MRHGARNFGFDLGYRQVDHDVTADKKNGSVNYKPVVYLVGSFQHAPRGSVAVELVRLRIASDTILGCGSRGTPRAGAETYSSSMSAPAPAPDR